MSKSITLLDHRVAWELFREEWRIKLLGRLFACPDYFCGVGEWQPQPDQVVIDDEFATRIAASAHREVAFNAPNVSATYFGETLVNENAIRIIFEFTEYGADWKDPIRDRSGFGKNLSDVMYQRNMYGLWGYVELRRKYHLGMGSARRRKANDVGHEDRASDDYIGT